jgi:hypothetical protein
MAANRYSDAVPTAEFIELMLTMIIKKGEDKDFRSGLRVEKLGRTRKLLFSICSIPAEIRTCYFPNTSLQPYESAPLHFM